MDPELKKQMKERYDTLPDDLKKSIVSSNYQSTLIEIAKKYQLNVAQLGGLELETTLVMFGFEKPTDYSFNIEQELGISEDVAQKITRDVDERVFANIRDSLKKINDEEMSEKELNKKLDYEEKKIEENTTQVEVSPEKSSLTNDRLQNVVQNMETAQAVAEMPATASQSKLTQAEINGEESLNREDILKEIEEMPENNSPKFNFTKKEQPPTEKTVESKIAPSIFEGKMGGEFSIPQAVTDRSVPNINPEKPAPKSADPYHEPI